MYDCFTNGRCREDCGTANTGTSSMTQGTVTLDVVYARDPNSRNTHPSVAFRGMCWFNSRSSGTIASNDVFPGTDPTPISVQSPKEWR